MKSGAIVLGILLGFSSSGLAVAQTWQHAGPRGVSPGPVVCCDLAADPHGVVHLAYQDQSLGVNPATVQRFSNGTWQFVGLEGGASIHQAWYDHLGFDAAGNVSLACRDYGVDGKINLRRFTPSTGAWADVGTAGASSGEAHYTDVAIASDGSPWVVFADRTTTPPDRATVLHFTDGAWSVAGAPGISELDAQYTSIALGPDGVPYVAFTDRSRLDPTQTGKISVMRYDEASNAWSYVGPQGFSPTGGSNGRIAFDRTGAPCVAYHQYHIAIRVFRFDGSQWSPIGLSASGTDRPTVETEAWRQWLSFAFDSQNKPYVAYQRFDDQNRAAVRCFDGSEWVPVGSLGFSPPNADYLAMALDRADVPWVAFRDSENEKRATVLRLSSPPSTYCTSSTDDLGCNPGIGAIVTPGGFVIVTNGLVNHRSAVLVYGTAPANLPFAGARLCVAPPYHTIGGLKTGGAQVFGDCSGAVSVDFAAWIRGGGDPSIVPGTTVFAQLWFRDPWNRSGAGATDALRFELRL